MRRILLLIMALCYLASITGVAVQWHYCMGKLLSIDLSYSASNEACSKCGMQKKDNHCCDDAVNFSKVTDAHQQIGEAVYNPLDASFYLPSFEHALFPIADCAQGNASLKISPPPILKANRSILFCVFRC
jgi:hypothetical protein